MYVKESLLPLGELRAHFRGPLFFAALSAMLFFASSCSMPFKGPAYREVGMASWYGDQFHGRPTASGEVFDMNRVSAAHRTLPLGTKVKVTNLENDKTVKVVINDRGPFVRDRIIDLSKGAAKRLGMESQGLAKVKIEASSISKESSASPRAGHGQLYTVQVGSFSDRRLASGLIEKLGKWRNDAYIVKFKMKKDLLYRVRIGSFNSIDKAEDLAKELKKKGYEPFVAAK